MNFITELQRRKVFKVGAAYLVAAWLIVQAASIGFPAFFRLRWASGRLFGWPDQAVS